MRTVRPRPARPRGRRSTRTTPEWIDISVPLRTDLVHWPGDPNMLVDRIRNMERGEPCNVSLLTMSTHTGTHIDPPLHFVPDGAAVDAMPFSATIGPARVIEIRAPEAIRPKELERHDLQPGERLLFKTRNSPRCWESAGFVEDFVYIAHAAAEYLAERRVCTVGVDYLSVGGFQRDGRETHLALLRAGIWVIEGLNLSRVRPGPYELICLPLRIEGGDGGPARAILRKGVR